MLDIQRIIQLKAQGGSNRSIGRLLGINRKTVNEHVQALSRPDTDFADLGQLDQETPASRLPGPKISSRPELELQ